MPPLSSATLTTIARKVGLSVSTVSYALRNHPRTAPETKARVLAAAKELNYHPNPAVASLMTQIRRGRRPSTGTRLAFIWVEATRLEIQADPLYRDVVAGARARSEVLGFGIEEFWLHDPLMSARRLEQILKARGIVGVVFSPCEREASVNLDWDWSSFAMAVIGNAAWPVELHRATHHHYASMKLCLEMAAQYGCNRTVALLDEKVNARANRTWEASFLTFAPNTAAARERLWRGSPAQGAQARSFVRKLKADCVITSSPEFAPADACAVPGSGRPWWIMLNREISPSRFSGVHPDYARIAANAVDLVTGQLFRNEHGIPPDPKLLYFRGRWQPGQPGTV